MERRTLPIPVVSRKGTLKVFGITMSLLSVSVILGGTVFFWPLMTVVHLLNIYQVYGAWRRGSHKGTPLNITVPVPGHTPKQVTPPPRTPAAFPPKPGQCYVCGLYDTDRQGVFGEDTHWSCVEWLGKWDMPEWKITRYVPGFGSMYLGSIPGTYTTAKVIDACRERFPHYLENDRLEAKIGTGAAARVIDIPPLKKPIDPEVRRRFYAGESATDGGTKPLFTGSGITAAQVRKAAEELQLQVQRHAEELTEVQGRLRKSLDQITSAPVAGSCRCGCGLNEYTAKRIFRKGSSGHWIAFCAPSDAPSGWSTTRFQAAINHHLNRKNYS